MGKKRYNPRPEFNQLVLSKKIEKLEHKIELHRKSIEAISKSNDIHIARLGNFARHDIKNAILSMDSILTLTEIEEFNEEKKESLILYLNVIRNTMDNFAELVPYSSNGKFTINTLMIAIDLLTRADIQYNKVDFKLNYNKKDKTELSLPFQSLIQIINNLIINSLKALERNEKKVIIIECYVDDNLIFSISDNGLSIDDEIKDEIFEYGFSSTGGSGIGLFHAKYICEQLQGNICLNCIKDSELTKTFCITLPLCAK